MMRIGFVGTGTIASAVVRGIAGDGHDICVSDRSADKAAALAAAFDTVRIAPNQQVIDASDVVFLGLMSDAAPGILDALQFRPDQQVISFMAGMGLDAVADIVAPARAAAVMMPFPGIAEGGSPIMMLGDDALVSRIFGARNTIFLLGSEAELAAYLCAQAVLSPAARMISDAATWLAPKVQDPEQAEAFLRLLVGSSVSGATCDALIAALNTPGGFNQRLRLHMEEAGISSILKQGLDRLEQED